MNNSQQVVIYLSTVLILFGTFGCVPLLTPIDLPKDETNVLTPKVSSPTPSEVIAITSTTTQTEIPTLTPTPEPTEIPSTATPVIDFSIPEPPSNADADIWRQAYIDVMLNGGYVRLMADAGKVKPRWDGFLKTVVWDLGLDKYAYNTEFGFTGQVVNDTYGKEWIVKKVVSAPRTAVIDYYRLHKTGKNELIMGLQCFEKTFDDAVSALRCLIVGQVVGVETLNMEDSLVNNYDSMLPEERGVLFDDTDDYNFSFLQVRVPAWDGFREMRIPICPVRYCGKNVVNIQTVKAGYEMTGSDFLDRMDPGDMVFVEFGVLRTNPMTREEWAIQFEDAGEDLKIRQSMYEAFGTGSLLVEVFNREFGLNLSTRFPETITGLLPIFDLEKLSQENIVIPASDFIY
jgi:hypothetical protein